MEDGGNGGTAPLTLNLGTRCRKRPRYLLNGRMEDSTDVSVEVIRYKNERKEARGQLQAQTLPSGNCPPIRLEQQAWWLPGARQGLLEKRKLRPTCPESSAHRFLHRLSHPSSPQSSNVTSPGRSQSARSHDRSEHHFVHY
jgi:hypothetical protein